MELIEQIRDDTLGYVGGVWKAVRLAREAADKIEELEALLDQVYKSEKQLGEEIERLRAENVELKEEVAWFANKPDGRIQNRRSLVERLRKFRVPAVSGKDPYWRPDVCQEAADEIERLECQCARLLELMEDERSLRESDKREVAAEIERVRKENAELKGACITKGSDGMSEAVQIRFIPIK